MVEAQSQMREDIQIILKSRGGECLSKYINAHTKLKWKCSKGHVWEASPNSIKRGIWCPQCAGVSRLSIGIFQKVAHEKGGRCLSEIYTNNRTHLIFQCKNKHTWTTPPKSILKGTWCPHCSGRVKGNIEEMRAMASNRGGKCNSVDYVNAQTPLEWECSLGHTWPATPNSIKNGSWCPECDTKIGERICRLFFEAIFKTSFTKVRPKELKSTRGSWLELDGYSDKLNLAFEHQGTQHEEYSAFFHRSKENYQRRLKDDQLKRDYCQKYGIKLIEVPQIPVRLPVDGI